jgi:hypothetical protein
MKETAVIAEEVAMSEAATVLFLNLTIGFVHSLSMLFLIYNILCLSPSMHFSISTPDRLYGFLRLLVFRISFSILPTASPVASFVFSGSPLSSF